MKRISDEDFQSWRDNPITQTFFKHLSNMKDMAHSRWVSEMMRDIDRAEPNPSEALQLLRFELKAKCEFIEDIIGIELKDIQDDDEGSAQINTGRAAKRR